MTRKPAAVERYPGVHQRHVQRVPDQVIDQYRDPANAQRFVYKLHELLWRQMVGEQSAAQQIERCAAEGKSESITGHRGRHCSMKVRCDAARSSEVICRLNPRRNRRSLAVCGTYPVPAATSSSDNDDELI